MQRHARTYARTYIRICMHTRTQRALLATNFRTCMFIFSPFFSFSVSLVCRHCALFRRWCGVTLCFWHEHQSTRARWYAHMHACWYFTLSGALIFHNQFDIYTHAPHLCTRIRTITHMHERGYSQTLVYTYLHIRIHSRTRKWDF